jgi:predicted ester cyclase
LILWRPVGQAELDLIAASGWRAFPPRLTGQPIFSAELRAVVRTFPDYRWELRRLVVDAPWIAAHFTERSGRPCRVCLSRSPLSQSPG